MKFHGSIDMAEGTSVKNLTVASGPAYPDEPNLGELFYHTVDGLCLYTTEWISISSISESSVLGTTGQIVVTDNGNGTSTLSIAQDAVLPGAGAIQIPSGPTAQRKSNVLDGGFRYNEDTKGFEGFADGAWVKFIVGASDLSALQMRRTTTRTLNTTQTEITFDTVDYSNSTDLVRGTNTAQLIAATAGLYAVTFECECINTTNANIDYFQMRLNGVAIPRGLITLNCRSTRMRASKTIFVYLNADDYITVVGYSSTGTTGTMQIGATLSAFSMRGAQGPAGPAGGQGSIYLAAPQFDNPVTSNWAVNALAPVSADPINTALPVRAFDDTLEEGIGFTVYVPPGVSSMTINVTGKAATAPAGSAAVVMRMYGRAVNAGSAVGVWSSAVQLTAFDIGANTFYQTYLRTIPIASLGLTEGTTAQIELTRQGNAAEDTLSGDFQLLNALVSFA